jgi:hypothetical protein
MRLRAAQLLAVSTLLCACAPKSENAEPPHDDWVLNTHVVFVESDWKTVRAAPAEPMRLWMPYVVGDLYGSPNGGEIEPVALGPDMSFTLNLNLGHRRLERALEPTQFSQKWMNIEPQDARVARLLPYVMQAEGITPLGLSEWLDTDTATRLMLVYFDRPARVRGEIVYEGRSLRFDIEAKEAGYLWIRQPDGSGTYSAVARPVHLVLAVMPGA